MTSKIVIELSLLLSLLPGDFLVSFKAKIFHEIANRFNVPSIDVNRVNSLALKEQLYTALTFTGDTGVKFLIMCTLNFEELFDLR